MFEFLKKSQPNCTKKTAILNNIPFAETQISPIFAPTKN